MASNTLTLTYGRNSVGEVLHERAVILTYSDVQKYFKLLRRHGFPVRYFVTGEYGSEKGRAHWHVVMFWLKAVPPFSGWDQWGQWVKDAQQQRFNHVRVDPKTGEPVYLPDTSPAYYWPHGFSHFASVDYAELRYNCKYIQKDIGQAERQGHLSMSKKPPLGAAYFAALAERYVAQGLAPQTLEYRFPEAKRRDGSMVPFQLGRDSASARLFLQHYCETWARTYPGKAMPPSKVVEEFTDPGAWRNRAASAVPWVDPPPKPEPVVSYRWLTDDEIDWQIRWERQNGLIEQQQSEFDRLREFFE